MESSDLGTLNLIAVLLGQAPGAATDVGEKGGPVPDGPDNIAVCIPADTLRQRPDVRSAERALAAATARIGVAQAALLPSLNISGDVGTSALPLGKLTDVVTGGLFASIAQVILDRKSTRLNSSH